MPGCTAGTVVPSSSTGPSVPVLRGKSSGQREVTRIYSQLRSLARDPASVGTGSAPLPTTTAATPQPITMDDKNKRTSDQRRIDEYGDFSQQNWTAFTDSAAAAVAAQGQGLSGLTPQPSRARSDSGLTTAMANAQVCQCMPRTRASHTCMEAEYSPRWLSDEYSHSYGHKIFSLSLALTCAQMMNAMGGQLPFANTTFVPQSPTPQSTSPHS